MRLGDNARSVILEEVRALFGPGATVSLFGSRTDDGARGGDIDLLVQTERVIPERRRKSLQLAARLQLRLGDQPIDIVLVDPETPIGAIQASAIRNGQKLRLRSCRATASASSPRWRSSLARDATCTTAGNTYSPSRSTHDGSPA